MMLVDPAGELETRSAARAADNHPYPPPVALRLFPALRQFFPRIFEQWFVTRQKLFRLPFGRLHIARIDRFLSQHLLLTIHRNQHDFIPFRPRPILCL
jgi:hypothetical protein